MSETKTQNAMNFSINYMRDWYTTPEWWK